MGFFISKDFGYYEGDKANASDIEVPQRPDGDHVWDGSAWGVDSAKWNARIDAQISAVERQSLLPRVSRDFFRMTAIQAAAGEGISEAELLDRDSPHYSPGYAKLRQLDDQITELRRSRR